MRGVGPVRAQTLAQLGVVTVRDLIEHYPFRYDLTPKSQAIGSLQLGQTATVVGAITSVRTGGSGPVVAELVDSTGRMKLRWFNARYIGDRLARGQTVRASGQVGTHRELAQLVNPKFTIIEHGRDPLANDVDAFEPVYPAREGLTSRQIAAIVRAALGEVAAQIPELLPDSFRRRRSLPPRRTAIERYHRPTQASDADVARRRLAYDELLALQVAAQLRRHYRQERGSAAAIAVSAEVDRRIRARLPFTLTTGQDAAIADIVADIAHPRPMNRLLQADVGAGKTAVAIYAALATIAARRQVAFMAPTEILTEQHFQKVRAYLAGSRVRIGLLVGGQSKSERSGLLQQIARREIDLVIGTHALIETGVRFASLGLIIVDEQHKFGVLQRSAILAKATDQQAHYLVMTATPIPRTLAMTLFGDMDVSTISDGPPGRQPIVTRAIAASRMGEVWRFVRQRLAAGEQAYVVYPLVDESERLPLQAATAEVQRLARDVFPGVGVELVHGRMSPDAKAEVMERFRQGQTRVLVATTVIEVGVDVPAATVMVIQHAERYGLSQLHQLRGRIGRGQRKSFCILVDYSHAGEISDFRFPISESKAGSAAHPSENLDTKQPRQGQVGYRKSTIVAAAIPERLAILCRTSDGFRIAEEDLRLRGPGDVAGARQHGLPALKVADLTTDMEILLWAREDAARIVLNDSCLARAEHAELRRQVIARHGETAALIG